MSSAYDQQIKKLIDHIQTLNQALHERNMQIVQWQQVARAVQDERARIARSLLDMLKQALAGFATKFQGLRAENLKLRAYIDHQKQLHEVVARDMQGQLQYALTRIDELASERAQWRGEVNEARVHASQLQGQAHQQGGVIGSQQKALAELKRQLEAAMRFADMEEEYKAEMNHLHEQVATLKTQLSGADQQVSGKERALEAALKDFDAFKLRANQEVQALQVQMSQEIAQLQAELSQNRATSANVDDRVDEMTSLLGNSEREVAKLFRELSEERTLHNESKIRLESAAKELRKVKTSLTKLEKAEKVGKFEQMTELAKRLEEMTRDYKELQDELAGALRDKTNYMQALEGQKPKIRPLQPPAEGNQ